MDADGPVAIKNDLIGSCSFDAANVYFHKVGGWGGGGIENKRKENGAGEREGGREGANSFEIMGWCRTSGEFESRRCNSIFCRVKRMTLCVEGEKPTKTCLAC